MTPVEARAVSKLGERFDVARDGHVQIVAALRNRSLEQNVPRGRLRKSLYTRKAAERL